VIVIMLSAANKLFMLILTKLNVVRLNAAMLNVVAPLEVMKRSQNVHMMLN
jgi:hypothetical protein